MRAAATLLALASLCPAEERPNVVVLIGDDLAVGCMGWEGHSFSKTPNLDRLAAEGTRCVNAFVTTPLCSPSRASFLTGRHARSHGVRVNRDRLPSDLPTFASLLTASGYDSAYVGKWHMGDDASPRPGFAFTASYVGQGKYNGNTFLVGGPGGVVPVEDPRWVDEASTERALEFLRREREAPFLLVLGFKGPHRPQIPSREDRKRYEGEPLPLPSNASARPPFPLGHEYARLAEEAQVEAEGYLLPAGWLAPEGPREAMGWPGRRGGDDGRERDYYRVLHGVDRCVGRLLTELDELAISDDTLVVFVSDNGMCLGNHGMVGKRVAYEESLRVPMILRYPGQVLAGADLEPMVLGIDLAPTLLSMAGVEVPEQMKGRDLSGLLAGKKVPWRDRALFEFYLDDLEHVPSFLPTNFAVRTERWKLIDYPGHPQWTELYDLAEDPGEQSNLAGDPTASELVETLRQELARLEAEAR